jgi:REP element-mobilizing transposase RayT
LTYPGAFHHATNRGINGEGIFASDSDKSCFLELLGNKAKLNGIRVFAYCLMDNHYHLLLENSSGRLSQFFKQLNGHYGLHYRQKTGSKGYVFQSRFYSSLIQDEAYLTLAIRYVLLNPVKAGLVASAISYPWSSARLYFNGSKNSWLASDFVEGLFGTRQNLVDALHEASDAHLPVVKTRLGPIVGNEDFLEGALDKFERRKVVADEKRMRGDDRFLEPEEKVIQEFESKHKVKIESIDRSTYAGKRLRGELLVWLHDLAGLKYPQIAELPLFFDLKFQSLGHLYKNAKRRESEEYKN